MNLLMLKNYFIYIIMLSPRNKRTHNFNILIEEKWFDYYWEFIKNNMITKNFYWIGLSCNKNININIINNNLHLQWSWDHIIVNPNINIDFIKNTVLHNIFEWDTLSCCDLITFDFVKNNLNLSWDWWCLSEHKNITLDDIESNFKQGLKLPWYISNVSNNPNITIDFIIKMYLKYKIDNNSVFNWSVVSSHKNITMEDIESTINYLPWNWTYVSCNPNLTIDMIKKYRNKKWDFYNISSNSNIKMSDISDNYKQGLDLPWNFYRISLNPNFTIDMYIKYPHKDWDMYLISFHKNITMNIV